MGAPRCGAKGRPLGGNTCTFLRRPGDPVSSVSTRITGRFDWQGGPLGPLQRGRRAELCRNADVGSKLARPGPKAPRDIAEPRLLS